MASQTAQTALFERSVGPGFGREFVRDGSSLTQTLSLPGISATTSVRAPLASGDLLGDWWRAYLRGERPTAMAPRGSLRLLELFSGPGGLSLGIRQACAELGFELKHVLANDRDVDALEVYKANHHPDAIFTESASSFVDFHVKGSRASAAFHYPPDLVLDEWQHLVGAVDIVAGGPPCQGHSNLNNKTRRTDNRNDLYLTLPAVAVAVEAPIVIIENVPAVVHDNAGVVEATTALLEANGYEVATGALNAADLGWAQSRSRFFLIARRGNAPIPLKQIGTFLADEARPIGWAIDDLADTLNDGFMTELPEFNDDSIRRINWLFDNDAHELALDQRPDCHKDGTTYTAVYGRMYADRPAPTITTGFVTPGRGRFVHPTRRRVLTALEAARLQGFPDTYDFSLNGETPSRSLLTKWIGDAVPMPLGYAATLSALGNGWGD